MATRPAITTTTTPNFGMGPSRSARRMSEATRRMVGLLLHLLSYPRFQTRLLSTACPGGARSASNGDRRAPREALHGREQRVLIERLLQEAVGRLDRRAGRDGDDGDPRERRVV